MATNNVFIIHNTAGVPVAAIQPDTLNGPDGVQQSSDLRLYGLGFATWGEGVDENDYRLLENFACPENSSFPGTPQGSNVLGDGNGVNVPIIGQLWFNTTSQKMFVFKATGWDTVAGTVATGIVAPSPPALGQLWYNTAIPQLEVYNGTSFVSVANLYLPLGGGTMVGDINMGNNNVVGANNVTTSIVNSTYYRAGNGVASNQITIPVSGADNNVDGPRIGSFLIYHQGNPPPSLFSYVVGMVMGWWGTPGSVPTGWHICDGGTYNGHLTPNLIGQVPFGANPGLGNTGPRTLSLTTGNALTNISIGGTSLSIAQMPSHNHLTDFFTGNGQNQAGPPGISSGTAYWFSGGGAGTRQTVTSGSTGAGTTHTHNLTDPQHSHPLSVPVYGIYFIMYTG